MRKKLSKNLVWILLLAVVGLYATACTTTKNISQAQTQTKVANQISSITSSSNDNANSVMQSESKEKRYDVELDTQPKKGVEIYDLSVSKTGKVVLNEQTRRSFNLWFSIFANAGLGPFSEKNLKSEAAVRFALWRLFKVDKPSVKTVEIVGVR